MIYKYVKNLTALFNSTLKICQQTTGPLAVKLINRLQEFFYFYKSIVCMGSGIIAVYLYYPLKSYVVDGVRVPFVPLEIMFVDQSTTFWSVF